MLAGRGVGVRTAGVDAIASGVRVAGTVNAEPVAVARGPGVTVTRVSDSSGSTVGNADAVAVAEEVGLGVASSGRPTAVGVAVGWVMVRTSRPGQASQAPRGQNHQSQRDAELAPGRTPPGHARAALAFFQLGVHPLAPAHAAAH